MFQLLRLTPEEALQPEQKDLMDRLSKLEKIKACVAQWAMSRDPQRIEKILKATKEGDEHDEEKPEPGEEKGQSVSKQTEEEVKTEVKTEENKWRHIPSCLLFPPPL